MRYGSVCSGIEAATAAWHPLGWEPAFFSEIEAFPSAVLAHHYPAVPNLGDMTKFKEWPNANINVLVGGTPCQSFSVAGLRKGLDDPRGNLMLTFGAIAAKYRPEWLVWENVPGVLSANGGRDFGTFLGMLGQLGYGFAYRVLDAQYTGLAQRRKRVFVVGHSGGWRGAAAVLFERHSLSGDIAPSREAREVAPTIPSRSTGGGGLGTDFDLDGGLRVSHTLRAEYDASEDGTGRGTPIVPVLSSGQANAELTFGYSPALNCNRDGSPIAFTQNQRDEIRILETAGALSAQPGMKQQTYMAFGWQNSPSQGDSVSSNITPTLDKSKTPAVAVSLRGREGGATAELGDEVGGCLRASSGGGDKPHVMTAMQVRRPTPVECERLQGFPDNYTAIPYRNKPASKCPDGPRYKALGNSMAVPVMRWIGERIQIVDDIYRAECEPVEAQA